MVSRECTLHTSVRESKVSKGLKWQNLWDFSDLLPENYRNMPEGARELAKNGDYNTCGGDYYVVQDFISAVRGEKTSPIDIYDACEWSAVALLSELSAMNNARPLKMPNFRDKDCEKIIKI